MGDILKHLLSKSKIRGSAYMWDRLICEYILYLWFSWWTWFWFVDIFVFLEIDGFCASTFWVVFFLNEISFQFHWSIILSPAAVLWVDLEYCTYSFPCMFHRCCTFECLCTLTSHVDAQLNNTSVSFFLVVNIKLICCIALSLPRLPRLISQCCSNGPGYMNNLGSNK